MGRLGLEVEKLAEVGAVEDNKVGSEEGGCCGLEAEAERVSEEQGGCSLVGPEPASGAGSALEGVLSDNEIERGKKGEVSQVRSGKMV